MCFGHSIKTHFFSKHIKMFCIIWQRLRFDSLQSTLICFPWRIAADSNETWFFLCLWYLTPSCQISQSERTYVLAPEERPLPRMIWAMVWASLTSICWRIFFFLRRDATACFSLPSCTRDQEGMFGEISARFRTRWVSPRPWACQQSGHADIETSRLN